VDLASHHVFGVAAALSFLLLAGAVFARDLGICLGD